MTSALIAPSPAALARALRVAPPLPTHVLRILADVDVELDFREMVRRLLPQEAEAILHAGSGGRDREATRTWAFCEAFEHHYFPIYEQDELHPLIYCIPFVALGWSYDDFHDLDRRQGTLMLRAICAEPYASNVGARVPLLEAVEGLGISHDVLLRIPVDGIPPGDLHSALDGTPYSALAEFADWTWGQTDLAFLDCDSDMEVVDSEWTDENVRELTRQWKLADALMQRVSALEAWLEQDPAPRFAELLDSALHRLTDLRTASDGGANAQEQDIAESTSGTAMPAVTVSPAAAA